MTRRNWRACRVGAGRQTNLVVASRVGGGRVPFGCRAEGPHGHQASPAQRGLRLPATRFKRSPTIHVDVIGRWSRVQIGPDAAVTTLICDDTGNGRSDPRLRKKATRWPSRRSTRLSCQSCRAGHLVEIGRPARNVQSPTESRVTFVRRARSAAAMKLLFFAPRVHSVPQEATGCVALITAAALRT